MDDLSKKAFVSLGLLFVVMAALLFVAAETLMWGEAWVYLGIFFGAGFLHDALSRPA